MAGPADFAVSPDGTELALVATGNSWGELGLPKLMQFPIGGGDLPLSCAAGSPDDIGGEPTAVAWDGRGRVVVQSREPAQIQIVGGPTFVLSDDSRADTGLALLHMNAGTGISCSSCHAEGGEDGRTWTFGGIGKRRTQNLAGGLLGREPFHWDGSLQDFHTLVHEVFVSRMSGPRPNKAQIPPPSRFRRCSESELAPRSCTTGAPRRCTSALAGAAAATSTASPLT